VDPARVKVMYLFVMLCYLFCHLDGGMISANLGNIKTYANLENSLTRLNMIPSALYFGNMIGCLVCPPAFNFISAKKINIAAAVFNGIFVSVFSFTSNFYAILITRIMVGIFQVRINLILIS
jgi:hypothetical protein